MSEYRAIGLMSGSSLDGLDIAYCQFKEKGGRWTYRIKETQCIPYSTEWINALKSLSNVAPRQFYKTDVELGRHFGRCVNDFVTQFNLENKIDFIASHGHTIFHYPDDGITCQIGDAATMADETRLTIVSNFRTTDIAAGGQGAPIVPIGDLHLFPEYDFMLNIGGISNISAKTVNGMIAFDICSANQVMNYLAAANGKPFDDRGRMAASGKSNQVLLEQLNKLPYYNLKFPKSLDNGFTDSEVLPILRASGCSIEDQLCTYVEHIALQISLHVQEIQMQTSNSPNGNEKMMITGGGVLNAYLIGRIKHHSKLEIIIPDQKLIEYKEAMVIAFMGVLRMRAEVNVLASVTGARQNTIGGVVHAATPRMET